jgi:fructokinase
MAKKRVIGIGETVLDILFKNDQPQKAVPGGSTFNSIVSLGRAGVNCAMVTEVGARMFASRLETISAMSLLQS